MSSGGNETILALSKLLSTSFLALNPKHGKITTQKVAYIIEDQCIGCMKCIKVCPMDAIVGAPKLMHTVITNDCSVATFVSIPALSIVLKCKR